MKLRKLLDRIPDLEVKGSKEVEITGICSNSKLVSPGNLFIAKKGVKADGSKFIPDAVAAGASALLTDFYNPFFPVTQLIHPDITQIEAKLAAQFYHRPSKELTVIGITGTNGKTTTSFLIHHIFEKVGIPTGLIGGVEWIVGNHRYPAELTTADVITNQKLLREMISEKCEAAVMEVSSHGLDQNRVGEIDFDIGIFTNLYREHLDYHKTMEEYARAKSKLFLNLKEKAWAIFNADDPISFPTNAKILTYGIEKEADVVAKGIKFFENKTQFTLCYRGKEIALISPLIGKFNVYNVLAAISACLCKKKGLEECAQALKTFKGVPGRLEQVKNSLKLQIFVDHAHKPDALENVLKTLREIGRGKIITVFGSGGDRDRGNRPLMGEVSSRLSDFSFITSDNPRSEDPEQIIREIVAGFSEKNYAVEPDRKIAIEKAIALAEPQDIVLIAGKGHEKSQIFAHQILPFDDVAISKEICHEREEICG